MMNLVGLVMVTIGALLGGFCTPAPTVTKEGYVTIGGERTPEYVKRMRRKYFLQKYGFPISLGLIATGSGLQFIAALADL